jgi:uncharacterized protein YjbI with pentapeptide repeats
MPTTFRIRRTECSGCVSPELPLDKGSVRSHRRVISSVNLEVYLKEADLQGADLEEAILREPHVKGRG